MKDPKIIVALDVPTSRQALALSRRLDPALCRLKVGKELFTAAGPKLVERLVEQGYPVFLDLKFHDIPNTVAHACKAAAQLGVWMMNVHALGGKKMMGAAREALEGARQRPKLVAVTLLTSMGREDLLDLGIHDEPAEVVMRLASRAHDCGLDGVVCSAEEARMLKARFGKQFCLVTPGIRPRGAALDDQTRVATPRAALGNGADYLVIGRPITQAPDPRQALEDICKEIGG